MSQTVNPAEHTFRDLDNIEADEDWMRNQKGEGATEQFGPDLSHTVNPADHSFRDTDYIDHDMDWHRGKKTDDFVDRFGPDLSQTVNPADHSFREMVNIDHAVDWHRGHKEDQVLESLRPDLTVVEAGIHNQEFRDSEKVDYALDWHRGRAAELDNSFQEFEALDQIRKGSDQYTPLQDAVANHKYRQLVRIDHSVDWHHASPVQKKGSFSGGLGEPGEDLELNKGLVRKGMEGRRGDFGGASELLKGRHAPDREVQGIAEQVARFKHREFQKIDRKYDWHGNDRTSGKPAWEQVPLSVSNAPASVPLMEQVSRFPNSTLRPLKSPEKKASAQEKGWNVSTHVNAAATPTADPGSDKKYGNPKAFLKGEKPLMEAVESFQRQGLRNSAQKPPKKGGWNVSTHVQQTVIVSGLPSGDDSIAAPPKKGSKDSPTKGDKPKLKPFNHGQPGKLIYNTVEPDTQPLEVVPTDYVRSLRNGELSPTRPQSGSGGGGGGGDSVHQRVFRNERPKPKPFSHTQPGDLLASKFEDDRSVALKTGAPDPALGIHGRVDWKSSLRSSKPMELNFGEAREQVDQRPKRRARRASESMGAAAAAVPRELQEAAAGELGEQDQKQSQMQVQRSDRMPKSGTAVAAPPRRLSAAQPTIGNDPEIARTTSPGITTQIRKHQFRNYDDPKGKQGKGWVSTPAQKAPGFGELKKLPTMTPSQRLAKFRKAAYGDQARRNQARMDGKATPLKKFQQATHAIRLAERLEEARTADPSFKAASGQAALTAKDAIDGGKAAAADAIHDAADGAGNLVAAAAAIEAEDAHSDESDFY